MAVDQQAPAAEAGPGGGAGSDLGDKATFRLAAFGALLVVVLFAGYGIGRLNSGTASASAPVTASGNGSLGDGSSGNGASGNGTSGGSSGGGSGAMPGMVMDENQPHTHNADGTVTVSGGTTSMGSIVGGLSLSSGGLTLVPGGTVFTAGRAQRLSFRITGAGGAPVTTYALMQDRLLHLIIVRRDLTGFQHLHPTMAADGTWGIDLTLAEPGIYRMIADFTAIVGGQPIETSLGSDLTVSGDYVPHPMEAPARQATADGFTVGYEGTPSTASSQPILIDVTGAGGKPAALEPYLGAWGHLVVLRQGDVGYVHIHPETQLAGGKVKFWLSVPSSGTYRMFLNFQVAGQVHTAAWTVVVP